MFQTVRIIQKQPPCQPLQVLFINELCILVEPPQPNPLIRIADAMFLRKLTASAGFSPGIYYI